MHNMASSDGHSPSIRSAAPSFTQKYGTTLLDHGLRPLQPRGTARRLRAWRQHDASPHLGLYDEYAVEVRSTPTLPDAKDLPEEEQTLARQPRPLARRRPDLPLRQAADIQHARSHVAVRGPRRRPPQGRRLPSSRQPQVHPLPHGGVDPRRRRPRHEAPHGALRGHRRTVRPLRERRDAQRRRNPSDGREQQHGGRPAGDRHPQGGAARLAQVGARADEALRMARRSPR